MAQQQQQGIIIIKGHSNFVTVRIYKAIEWDCVCKCVRQEQVNGRSYHTL